ncbi:MAG: PilZ domain-containing protein [Planctomycetota bacterium]
MSTTTQPELSPPQLAALLDELVHTHLTEADWHDALTRIERAPGDIAGFAGPDRRAAGPRLPLRQSCLVRAQPAGGEPCVYLAGARDLSRGGLGLLMAHALMPGREVLVALETRDGHGQLLDAVVVRCERLDTEDRGKSVWELGVQFVQPLDPGPFLASADG